MIRQEEEEEQQQQQQKEQQDLRFIEMIKSREWTGHVDGMEKQTFLTKSQCKYQTK